ncbi:heavy-metal-associated domain-containing protein [Faunimonas sp. B44]|uniref:heavy-metal-associated domain-containing protein n=1 Tax=Faunimonas sp. B44 TaxID=3461493 RepID=UPI004043B7A9
MLRLHVPDMVCGGCARAVGKAVGALDPDARLEADPDSREARVTSSADPQALLAALEKAGFPAELKAAAPAA